MTEIVLVEAPPPDARDACGLGGGVGPHLAGHGVTTSWHSIDVMGGVTRRLLVAEPTATPSMVLLSLHGSRSSPEGQRRLSRMESLAARGAVVAFPQGGLPLGSGLGMGPLR